MITDQSHNLSANRDDKLKNSDDGPPFPEATITFTEDRIDLILGKRNPKGNPSSRGIANR